MSEIGGFTKGCDSLMGCERNRCSGGQFFGLPFMKWNKKKGNQCAKNEWKPVLTRKMFLVTTRIQESIVQGTRCYDALRRWVSTCWPDLSLFCVVFPHLVVPAWTLRPVTWSWTAANRISPPPSSASPRHLLTHLTRAYRRRLLPCQAFCATRGPPRTPRTLSRFPPYNLWPGLPHLPYSPSSSAPPRSPSRAHPPSLSRELSVSR